MSCKTYRHPLVHKGTSQSERINPALLPSSVNLDDRSVADLMLFVHEMGRLFKYFNLENIEDGNWQAFFEKEEVSILSIIVAIDLDAYNDGYLEQEVNFWKIDSESSDLEERRGNRSENYQILINKIYELASRIHQICQSVPRELALHAEILEVIERQIVQAIFENRPQNALEQLIAYDKGSEPPATEKKYESFIYKDGNRSSCTKVWEIAGEDGYICILADDGYKEEQPVGECRENRKLRELFMIFYQALASIIERAKSHLSRVLAEDQDHEPHISLFLAFVFIFKYLQQQFRNITQRHLDYYYAEILGLKPLPFSPDQTYVLFELAKNFEDFILKPGTLLESVKDRNGNPLRYYLTNELVVNKSQVESLKSIYVKEASEGYEVFAAPIANSQDGQGGAFEAGEETRWRPMGDISGEATGEFGFVISSPEFTLREGERYINVNLSFQENSQAEALHSALDSIELSSPESENGWFSIAEKDGTLAQDDFDGDFTSFKQPVFSTYLDNKDLKIYFLVLSSNPPIDKPSEDLGEFFKYIKYPCLKFKLKSDTLSDASNKTSFSNLKNIQLTGIGIKVGVRGVRTLLLRSGNGTYDNTQPFPAFGKFLAGGGKSIPLIIGSDEVFRKNIIERFDVFFQVVDLGAITLSAPIVNILQDRSFGGNKSLTLLKVDPPNALPSEVPYPDVDASGIVNPQLYKLSISSGLGIQRIPHVELESFSFNSVNGFAKLTLSYGGVGADSFLLIQNFFINYIAEKDPDFEQKEQIFQINPFGFNEVRNSLDDTESISIIPGFHPPISHSPEDDLSSEVRESMLAGGNLYIGIKDLIPGQAVSLLFKVLEGSGNPSFNPPDIQWSYLVANEDLVIKEELPTAEEQFPGYSWKEFSPQDIVKDSTKVDPDSQKSLLKTGILQVNTSNKMAAAGTLIDPKAKLHWLRASAREDEGQNEFVASLPDLVAVHAQAALCQFINNGNSLEHLVETLPQGSIGKLSQRKTAIRKVEQPYATEKGKLVELPIPFYRRVHERLRHKNRAACIWDFERLILEAFPQVRHVKCLTHSSVSCEIDPGKVVVAVFPDLKNRNGVNRIEPGLGTGELKAIEKFLRDRSNLFLFCEGKIRVLNPLYELLKVSCCIRFRKGFLPQKYAQILDTDLQKFLAPWAFDIESEIFFSSEFHSSRILNFIEEQIYVDKVSEFQVYHFIKDPLSGVPVSQHFIQDEDSEDWEKAPVPKETILSSSARSIFTSFNHSEDEPVHMIHLLDDECQPCIADEFNRFDTCKES